MINMGAVFPISGQVNLATELARDPSKIQAEIVNEMKAIVDNFQWTNPELTKNLTRGIAATVQQEVEKAIKGAEKERNWWDWVSRSDVVNQLQLATQIYHRVQHHDTFLLAQGHLDVSRAKASIGGHDSIKLALNMKLKVLTMDREKMKQVNGSGKLREKLDNYDPFANMLEA